MVPSVEYKLKSLDASSFNQSRLLNQRMRERVNKLWVLVWFTVQCPPHNFKGRLEFLLVNSTMWGEIVS